MSTLLLGVLLLLSGGQCYNLSEMASWGPVLAASQLSSVMKTSIPLPIVRSESRSSRMISESPENWNSVAKPSDYYPTSAEIFDTEKRFYSPPDRKHGQDYKITIPEYPEYHYAHCQESKSSGEDGLSQIANVVSKIAKMLFGAFIIILLPLILAKLFFFPIKAFLVMKLLLKFMLLWPFLMRMMPAVMPTPSETARLSGSSGLEAMSELMDYLQTEYVYRNLTERVNNPNGNTTNEDYYEFSKAAPYCDTKMSCFLAKSMSSKNFIIRLATSAAVIFGDKTSALSPFIRFLKQRKEFKECVEIECSKSETNKARR